MGWGWRDVNYGEVKSLAEHDLDTGNWEGVQSTLLNVKWATSFYAFLNKSQGGEKKFPNSSAKLTKTHLNSRNNLGAFWVMQSGGTENKTEAINMLRNLPAFLCVNFFYKHLFL